MPAKMDLRAWSHAIVERFDNAATPSQLKPFIKQFKLTQAAFEAKAAAADDARDVRDDAALAIATADGKLDASLETLGNVLVGASLGSRKNPIQSFTKIRLSDLKDLAFAVEVAETKKLIKAISKVSPPASVKTTLATVTKNADAVEKALAALTKPEAAYKTALAARDVQVLTLTKTLGRLKKNANAAWADEPETYKSFFAPVPAVQAPKKAKKAKKKTSPAAPPPAPKP